MEAIVQSEGHQVTTCLSIYICLYTQEADQLTDRSVTLFIHLTLLRSTIRCLYVFCYVCSPVLLCLLCVFVTSSSSYCSHFWILDNQLLKVHLLYYLPASPFCHRDSVPAIAEHMWPEVIRCVAHHWPLSAAFQLTDHLKSSESPLPREFTLIGCSAKRISAQEETWIKKGKAPWVCCCGIHWFPQSLLKLFYQTRNGFIRESGLKKTTTVVCSSAVLSVLFSLLE